MTPLFIFIFCIPLSCVFHLNLCYIDMHKNVNHSLLRHNVIHWWWRFKPTTFQTQRYIFWENRVLHQWDLFMLCVLMSITCLICNKSSLMETLTFTIHLKNFSDPQYHENGMKKFPGPYKLTVYLCILRLRSILE